jgi:hypothetical protein
MPPAALLALWFSSTTTNSLAGFLLRLLGPVDSVGDGELPGEDDWLCVGVLDVDLADGGLSPLEQPAADKSAARHSSPTERLAAAISDSE